METQSFLDDLGKVAQARSDIANSMAIIVHELEEAEKINVNKSGKLELEQDIAEAKRLEQEKNWLFLMSVMP